MLRECFYLSVVIVGLILLSMSTCYAQADDPVELHYSILQGTGVNGINLPEVSLPDSNYNPASLPWSAIYGYKGSAYLQSGGIDTEGGSLSMYQLSANEKIGDLYFKINLYQTDCSSIKFIESSMLAGTETNFNIKASELQIAYPLARNLFVGGALVLNENSNMHLRVSEPNLPLYSASSNAAANFRIGLQYLPSEKITLGAVYSHRQDHFDAIYYPALTMQENNINSSCDYNTNMYTLGMSWQIGPSTLIFYNHQFVNTIGPYGLTDYNYAYYGLQQNFGQNFNVRLASNDGAPEIQLNYHNKNFFMGAYYSEGSKQFEPLVGRPKRYMFWTGITF